MTGIEGRREEALDAQEAEIRAAQEAEGYRLVGFDMEALEGRVQRAVSVPTYRAQTGSAMEDFEARRVHLGTSVETPLEQGLYGELQGALDEVTQKRRVNARLGDRYVEAEASRQEALARIQKAIVYLGEDATPALLDILEGKK